MARKLVAFACSLLLVFSSFHLPAALAEEPAPAGPLPSDDGQIIQSLNGNWHFRIDPAGIGEQQGWQDPGHDRSQWDRLRVPGNWDVRNEYSDYAGIGWYARTFAVPAEYEGFRVRLKFEAVYFHARVWVNGVFVGEHYGGYTPFEFDVSELLRYGGSDNLVVVAADNRYGTGAWWKWGGISGDVDLIVNNDARILWQKITPEPDLASGEAVIRTEVKVENDAGEDRTFQVRLRIRDWETGAVLRDWTTDPALSASVTVAAGSAGTAAVSTTLPPALVELWHFDDPNLYVMETHLEEDGTLLHRIEDRFGIRKVEIVGTEFRLNGEPVRLVGFNRVPDDRVNGNTEPDYLVMRDLDYMKTMGANMARIFHTPLSQNVLDYADEIGILLIGEIPVWGGRTAYDMTYARQWLREMIERDYNHPSIFAWSVANEIDGNEPAGMEFIREHIDYVRSELDSSRYLTYAMHQGKIGATPDGDAAQYVDFISVNLYGDGSSAVNRLHSLWPDKPIFLSEFGSSQTSEDPNKGNFKVEGLLQAYKRDYIMGVSLWTLNDYRSNFPGTPPSQNRAWGVTTVWGEKKRAFERVRAAYAPVRLSVEHSAADFVPGTAVLSNIRVIPRSADADIPSYTMRGYKLKWEIYDRSGRAREGGLLDLDTIRPGAPEIRLPVSWIVPDDALYMRVSVITPLQYEIVEAISDLDVPDAPVIRDVLVADGAVRVIFDKVNGAREYRVVYGETTLAASSEATINNFVDITGLQNGKAHRFAVVAMNGKGESNKSPVVTAVPTFLYDRLPPVLWAAVPVEGGVYIGYSVENEDAEFTLEYGESPDRTTNVITGIRNRGAYLVSGLEGGKTYYFRMKRAGSYGESGFSQAIAAVPETALQLPPAPEIVAAAAGDGQVSLQFTTVPKATGYVIRYGTSPGETLGEIPVRSAAVGQYVVSGLQNGTAYYFAVRARTASGLSPWSGEVSAVPAPVQAPGLSHQVDPGEGEWEAGTVRTLRLHLSNLGLAALQAEVELQLPAGFTGAGLTQSVTIHPGDTTEVSWDIAIDALQEPGTYHLTAIIRYGDGEELRVVIPVTVKRYEILFAEDFETDLSRWTTATGTGDLSADADSQAFRHLAPSTTTFALSHAGDGDWADYIVSAKMKMVGALNPTLKTGGYSAGIVFRYLDANNFYHLRLDHNFGTGVSKAQLYRWVNGAPSNLREVVYDWTDGQWYTLKAAVRGNQIDAYVNGVLMFSVTDSSLAAGKVGFRTYGAEALFDDVIVTDWGEGGGPSVDLTALEDAIHYAESLLARHPAGDQPGEVPQEAADELLSEIQLARQILSDPNLTQEAADSAAARLNDAAARFLEQVIPDPAEPVIRHVIRLDAPHLDAGGQTALTVRLHNAGHTQRSLTLTLELPGSLTADQIEKTVTLDAGQDGEASFTLTAAPDAAAGTYNFIVKVAYDGGQSTLAETVALQVRQYEWLFTEDFEGTADRWTLVSGTGGVKEDDGSRAYELVAPGATSSALVTAGDVSWNDYTVRARMKIASFHPDNNGYSAGILFRYVNNSNFYHFRVDKNSGAQLYKWVNGSAVNMGSRNVPWSVGAWAELKVVVQGDTITAYFNGQPVFNVTDSAHAAGKIGFRSYAATAVFDDVAVYRDIAPIDKTALQNLAETAAQLEADDYMPAGWAQLQAALALAQGVLDAEDSTRAEVNAAMEELQYAMRNLATRPDGLPDGVEKVPYRMDTLNQAGWWAPLAVDGDTAYLAYNEPSVREGNHHIAVAVRDGGGNWSKLPAMNGAARAEYIDDLGHNLPSIALDGNGILHMFASMHNDTWRYFALDPVSGTMQNRSADMPDQGDLLTYPVTARDPNGDVWLIIRSAASDRRVGKLYRYDHEQKTWTKEAIFASAPGRSVYPDDMLVDGEGNVHILFEWAPNPAAAVRHELSYLKYDPDTKTFHKADGTAVEAPVTPETADVIQPLTEGEGYNDTFGVQSAKLVLDENGRPMVAYRYRSADSQGMFVVKFARFTGEAWETETVFRLAETKAAIDITHHASGTRIYYVLASGQDCARVAVRQGEGWVNASVAPGIPAERLSAVTNDSGVDILYLADVENEALYYAELDSVDLEGDIPPAPTGLVTTGVSNLRVDLAWTAPNGGDGIAGYHIYRNGQRIGSSPVPAFSDMEVEAGTGYTYTVTAVGMSNLESAPSGALDVITLGHPALPFQDDFEQNGMVNWRVVSGTWTLEAGDSTRLVQSNTAGEGLVFAGNPHWTDYTAEMELTLNDIRDHAASGLLVRYVDESNHYILRLHQSGQLQLYKNAGGSFTLLGSASAAVSAGSTYKLKLKAEGDHLTAYLNGEEKIAVTDDAFPRGAVGVRSYNQSIAVDNVTVKAVPNRTALQNAIAQAQTLALQTAVGTEPGQVPQAAMDDLLAAIVAAEFVLRDDNAGQEDLDAAITALQAAIAAFLAAIIPEPQAPAWENGVLQASNVGVTEVTLSWSGAKDEQGVSAYRIYINGTPGDPLAAEDLTVTDGVYSHTVTGLAPETTYVFKVEAGNARNLWSTDGPVVTVTTLPAQQQEPEPTEPEDTQAPVWNGGQLTVRDVTATRLVLAWTPASDNVAVTAYRVYRNGGLIAEVAGDVLTLEVTGLAPSTAYTFKVEAGDAAGNWSTDGPAASVTTPSASTPPVTPPPTSTPPAEPPRQEEPAEEPAEEEPAEEKPAVRVEAADEALAEAVSGKGTGDALARVRLASPVYEVTFEGDEAPAEPVKIELAYDPSGVDEALLGVYGYNEETETWEYVGGEIGPGTGVMVAEASRPGLYAVMEYDKTFADVQEEHWAHAAIRQLSARHIVKGVSGEEFAPGKRTTRAEFAALLARALGLEAEAGEGTPFADVPEGAWYAEAVAAAHAAGLIEGLTEEAFGPDEPISREQMAVLLVRAYALLTGKEIAAGTDHLAGYTDGEDVSGWAREAVNAAIELGLMQGKGGGQFAPKEEATRAETAMVIWKLLNLLKQAAS